MEYERLIYRLGSLHSLLAELRDAGLYQGEHTIYYTSVDGIERTVHVYIEGTDLQMSDTPSDDTLNLSSFNVDLLDE